MNNKEKKDKIEKHIKELERLTGVKIEMENGKPKGKIVQSPNDPWTCDDCGNSVYSCRC